ncbi:SH3 domain-binding protein 5-like [Catharus ustulatus]|uniref:SH3 domain-binding protein 5 n=1 Tax=Catharus ustulatus TaxID=91951 RepID=A0A8C3UE35_CATUS|nr:SH3 domain-binding protein 5-like [Catharus ustulatus]
MGDWENSGNPPKEQEEEEEEEEELDPRIQEELEHLNEANAEINRGELELDAARCRYRRILSDSARKLNSQGSQLGTCIDRARPYYEARRRAKEAQQETQRAALRYERAVGMHNAAREMVFVAEQGMGTGKNRLDPTWQEMLNHATRKVNEAEQERLWSEREHQRVTRLCQEAEAEVQRLQKSLRRDIARSRPYFELKAQFNQRLEEHKSRVNSLESSVAQAKLRYSVALRNLEQISEEIHARRFQRILRKKQRENPLGAEGGAQNLEIPGEMGKIPGENGKIPGEIAKIPDEISGKIPAEIGKNSGIPGEMEIPGEMGIQGEIPSKIPGEIRISGEIPGKIPGENRGISADVSRISGKIPGEICGIPGKIPGEIHGTLGISGEIHGISGEISKIPGEIRGIPGKIPGEIHGISADVSRISGGIPGQIHGISAEISRLPGKIPGEIPEIHDEIRGIPGEIRQNPDEIDGIPGEIRGISADVSRIPGKIPGEIHGIPGGILGEIHGIPDKIRGIPGINDAIAKNLGISDQIRGISDAAVPGFSGDDSAVPSGISDSGDSLSVLSLQTIASDLQKFDSVEHLAAIPGISGIADALSLHSEELGEEREKRGRSFRHHRSVSL